MAATLFAMAGGEAGIRRLTERFYELVFADPLLAPFFTDTGAVHAERLALWLGELVGGPPEHTASRGGFTVMRGAHVGLRISADQRGRWAQLMFQACRDVGLSDEFIARFVPFVEGGSTFAQRVSWPSDQVWPR